MITITEAADQQVSALCKDNDCYAVTIDVKSGGCGGFEYDWNIAQEEDLNEEYHIIECGYGVLAVHKEAQKYLTGSEVDYIKNVFNQHFELRNPNVASECGCGVSINFDMDKITPL